MTVELEHPYEQIAEQLMYAEGASSIRDVVQHALAAQFANLTSDQKVRGFEGMLQAGLDSGFSEKSVDDVFNDILRDLQGITEVSDSKEHAA